MAEPLERRVLLTDAPAAPSFSFAKWAHDGPRQVSLFAGISDANLDPAAGVDGLTATVGWSRSGAEQPATILDLGGP